MNGQKRYTVEDSLAHHMQDPEFVKAWKETEPEFNLACKIIEARINKRMSQRELAEKAHTTQAVICRIETMNANPSVELLKRIARAFDKEVSIQFK